MMPTALGLPVRFSAFSSSSSFCLTGSSGLLASSRASSASLRGLSCGSLPADSEEEVLLPDCCSISWKLTEDWLFWLLFPAPGTAEKLDASFCIC